jgi:hypothetical protein
MIFLAAQRIRKLRRRADFSRGKLAFAFGMFGSFPTYLKKESSYILIWSEMFCINCIYICLALLIFDPHHFMSRDGLRGFVFFFCFWKCLRVCVHMIAWQILAGGSGFYEREPKKIILHFASGHG